MPEQMSAVRFLSVVMFVAMTEQRRTPFGARRLSLQSADGPGCAVDSGMPTHGDCCRHDITTSKDFDLVPRNLTAASLAFSAGHRLSFGRGTLPPELGGSRLRRLLVSVRYAPRRRLPAGFFVNLARLRSLQLYHDAPDSERFSLRLSEGTFEGLSGVVELQLARLGIEHLPAGVFGGLRSVCRLDLSRNRLGVIDAGVFQLPSASSPRGSTENRCCHNLTTLLLGRNRFVDVADIDLSGLTSLRSIDLYGNAIASLNRDSFSGARAETTSGGFATIDQLNLGLNVIGRIEDDAFERLARLRILYLDGNMISNVTASRFTGLPLVDTLDLGGNSISELRSGVFAPLTSLRTLSLAENAMDTIQTGAFFGLGKLRSLDLSYNRLHSLDDGTFRGLDALERLYVRGSQLVDVAARSLAPFARSLTHLELADNRLRTISFETLAAADRLTFVDLAGNPWTCDCRLRPTAGIGSVSLTAEWDLIVCNLPPDARHKLLRSVLGPNSSVICDSASTDRPSASPPLDFFERWFEYAWIATAVLLVLSAAVASTMMVNICRTRRSAVWTPCRDNVDAAGSGSETSSSDDVDRRSDDVGAVADDVTATRDGLQPPSLV